MGVYYTNEAAFELPEIGLVDRTVTNLEPTGGGVALLVNRAPLPADTSLDDLVSGNLRDATIRLTAVSVIFRRDAEIAGCPAIEIATVWRGSAGPVYTRQAHLAARGTWLVFAVNAPLEARAAGDRTMDLALSTFRLRG